MSTPDNNGAPLKPNWELARILYMQGVKSAIILEECHLTHHALRNRIFREQWKQDRLNIKAKVTHVTNPANGITLPSLAEAADIVRGTLSGALILAATGLDKVRAPKTHKARRELADTVKAIADPGKTVFPQWEVAQTTVINLNVLRAPRVVDAIELPAQVLLPESNPPNSAPEPEH